MIAVLDDAGGVTEALARWRGREVFPVDLSSAEMRGFSRELWGRSIMSARTTNAEYLQEVADTVDDILSGKINMATGRLRLFRKLKQLGYDPAVGFAQDMASIPPAEKDSLQDLSSVARLNLVLETNIRMARNYGRMVEGNTPYALHAYPAWELVRLYQRSVPRGTPESHTAGWMARWQDAGESVGWEGAVESPMIARKDSPIWQALGDGAGGYEDALSNPYPPFAFNSGMGWAEVDRVRCISLGLIFNDDTPVRMTGQLAPGSREMDSVCDRLSPELEEELRRELADDKERVSLRKSMQEFEAVADAKAESGKRAWLDFSRSMQKKFSEGLPA